MTERGAPPDRGFENRLDDPYEDDGWFGREQVGEPSFVEPVAPPTEPVAPVQERPRETQRAVHRPPAPPTRPRPTPTVNTWTVNGQLRASDTSTLTFRAPPEPWYRTKQAGIALLALFAAAVVVPIVVLAWPDSSSTGPAPSTSVAPQPPTTAQPVPSTAPSTPVNLPPPPPPPPPPAPPPEDTGSAPTYDQPYWTRPAPKPAEKAPTPVTRAPISVAPVPRRPSKVDTGDSNKPGCAGWC